MLWFKTFLSSRATRRRIHILLNYTLFLLFVIINLFGCTGYKLGVQKEFPGGAKKVAIPTFKNKTYEASIENAFTQALKYEISKSGYVNLVKVEDAEAIIQGTVSSLIVAPSNSSPREHKFQGGSQKRADKLLESSYIATVSVDIQVISKKLFKKKIFLSSPIHHHLEAIGWSEPKIVMRFWIISGVTSVIGIVIFLIDK